MTTTLGNMTAKKKLGSSAEEVAARELVRLAKEQGLSLTGPGGLLKQFTRSVLESALNEEMTGGRGELGGELAFFRVTLLAVAHDKGQPTHRRPSPRPLRT